MKLLYLPLDIVRHLVQAWVNAKGWSRLDSAFCATIDRSVFLNVMSTLQYSDAHYRWSKADLFFVWCALRQIKVIEFTIDCISFDRVDVLQFKNSPTVASLTYLGHKPLFDEYADIDWIMNLVSICPNIERLCLNNAEPNDILRLQEWCPKLTSLVLSQTEQAFTYSYRFSSLTSLKRLFIMETKMNKLSLPPQLEELSLWWCDVNEKTQVSALKSCPHLTKVSVSSFNSLGCNMSRNWFAMLPATLTALEFGGCSHLGFVFQKFTALTQLSISECRDITQHDFDCLFLLPHIIYLSLAYKDPPYVPGIERLSDGITCPTLKYLLLQSFESIDDDAMISIVQRCSGLRYIRTGLMHGLTVSFPALNDDAGRRAFIASD